MEPGSILQNAVERIPLVDHEGKSGAAHAVVDGWVEPDATVLVMCDLGDSVLSPSSTGACLPRRPVR